ncbi:S8 family serine peptidase [Phytohabitans rumicis]|uniref:S8 family serine peptidase n=1 Tax=Phytohabitans rumicis TaxID=1076125 RepID=UPI0031EF9F65
MAHPIVRTVAALCLAAATCAIGATPAAAAQRAPNCADPGQVIDTVPWAQRMLGPERVWPFTRGGGATVAVLSTGVDAGQDQLGNQVTEGFDAVAGSGPANDDCLGLGTQVAGVIAAQQTNAIGFAGLAPRVTIVPIRVVDTVSSLSVIDPGLIAKGIDAAVARGVHVIAVPVVTYTDSAALQDAVDRALASGAVVVAAVGDQGNRQGGSGKPYPASYDGVVGVGAIQEDGARWANSQQGDFVDIVAPGAGVVTLQTGRGMTVVNSTGVACGFVAATAAMIHARQSSLRGDQVTRQLLGTATPAAGGSAYGRGVVNPYAAVTERLVNGSPAPLPALAPQSGSESPAWARSRELALAGAGLAVLATLAVLVVAVVLPRGRRRFWRSAVAPMPAPRTEPEEPGPPIQLFPRP